MQSNRCMLRWAGTSAIALAAALSSGQALACSASRAPFYPEDPPMKITCPATDSPAAPFQSSHVVIDGDYDGSGPDILLMEGGSIVVGGDPVPVAVSIGSMYLDPSTGEVNLLGGADNVTMTSGNIGTAGQPLNLNMGEGANTGNISGGTIYGSLISGDDGDNFDITGGAIARGVFTNGGADVVTVGGSAVITARPGDEDRVAVGLGAGDDRFTMTGGRLQGGLSGEDGNDTLDVQGGAIDDYIDGGAGNDSISVTGGASVGGDILGEAGDDTVTVDGGSVAGYVSTADGNDQVFMRGGAIGSVGRPTGVVMGDGADTFTMSGGTVYGSILGQGGGNVYQVSGGTIVGSLFAGSQDDSVTISGTADIRAASGADSIGLEDGNDRFLMLGGVLQGSVSGNGGNDTMTVGGGTINGDFNGNDGDDTMGVTAGSVDGDVSGGAGTDSITISGGTITGNVAGDGGTDTVTVSGGNIQGGIDAETVHLHGGTIGGDISGIGPDTLTIDDTVSALDLRDGVIFSGTDAGDANATITGIDLADGGAKRQNFVSFDNVDVDGSKLAFAPGSTQQINLLTLRNGSTLYAPGGSGVSGAIDATGSTINMVNGVAGDVFTLGGITFHDSTLAIDLNQQTGQADQLVAAAFGATGANIINVNLIGAPAFAGETDIPIIVASGGAVPGTFTITGIPGTPGALFSYSVLQAPGGGLIVRATPNNFGIALAPDAAVNASIVDVAVDALYGINRDAIDADLMLANGAQKIAITPSFGIFASGQFAHTEHDGYDISSGIFGGTGPSFGANDFSAAISLDFNAAKHFQFDKQYGLNLGLFAGYASTDVGLDPFQGFADMGGGTNRSGMFGAYALFRKEFNYALVSASAFLGNTDVENGALATTGSYDTQGYAVTGSVGHIFMLGDRTRLDLRGGLLGVTFTGDSYTDSGGNEFGKSKISFGAVQFAPGVYGDFQVGDGKVFSPYARLELQQRFNARNTAEIDTRTVNFDDADFSAALSGGFNLKMTGATTLSGEVRGKWSSDSSTIGAKLGLKVAF